MRTAVAALTVVIAGCLSACQASPAASQATIAPARATATPGPAASPTAVAGVLVAPVGSIPMPGWADLSAPTSQVVWALINSSFLYLSTDQGNSWEERPLPPAALPQRTSFISFADRLTGWVLVPGVPETQCNGAGFDVRRTTDGGTTWTRIAAGDQPDQVEGGIGYAQCKRPISFIDAMHGFISAADGNRRPTIYRTSDGGSTWAASTLPDPPGFTTSAGGFALQAGQVHGFGGTLLVEARGMQASGSEEFVFRSMDGGATWSYAARAPQPQLPVAFLTESRWMQLVGPGQSSETTDGGQSWHTSPSDYSQAAPVAANVAFGDSSVGYATVRGQIQRTLDAGLHWSYIQTPGVTQPG